MASCVVSALWPACYCYHSKPSPFHDHRSSPSLPLKFRIHCKNSVQDSFSCISNGLHGGRRRDIMTQIGLLALSFPAVAWADNDVLEGFRVYTDEVNKFKISVPQDWEVGSGDSTGFKSVTAFYPQDNPTSNVSVVITGVGPDFTRMESFGKVDAFAETLVGGLDRSWQRPPGVAAKLIDCKSAKGFYYIGYSLQNPGESRRFLYTAIGMAFNGWYNRLYTVTGQFMEEESGKYGSKIEKAIASFCFI